jgi:hypothetical protein
MAKPADQNLYVKVVAKKQVHGFAPTCKQPTSVDFFTSANVDYALRCQKSPPPNVARRLQAYDAGRFC